MRALVVIAVFAASSCGRCGGARVADAGVDAGVVAVARKSVDLRTALIYVYPEYRGTATLEVLAQLRRTIPGLTDASRDAALAKLRYAPAEDGGWRLANFHLAQTGPSELTVSVAYDPDQLAHLYVSPVALTSMELGLYLPRELPVESEQFVFDVRYGSSAERSQKLVRHAVNLLLGNAQWQAKGEVPPPLDAGDVPLSEEETATLVGPEGALVTFHRMGGLVHVQYSLQTVAP